MAKDSAAAAPEPLTLKAVEIAIRGAFARDTCSEDDLSEWHEGNPSRGHCAVTTLMIHEFFGGDLVVAPVTRNGVQFGYHWWNRLGVLDFDLTRCQFAADERVGEPMVVDPPSDGHHYAAQFALFRSRVLAALEKASDTSIECTAT